MDLRPRQRHLFTGFTKPEVQKMEQLLDELKEQCLEEEFCKKIARVFNRSSGRAGKPIAKWTEIQSWFQKNQQRVTKGLDAAEKLSLIPEDLTESRTNENPKSVKGKVNEDVSKLEFEARSSKDGAWYDVETFRSHRFVSSGDFEVLVRYVGFGSEEDEWVNSKDAVRKRSVALEHSECQKVKVGDLVVCFQERQDQAKYYDCHVIDIQRRCHDIRGCRCLFLVRYSHDNSEEKVRLRRLCCQPNMLAKWE